MLNKLQEDHHTNQEFQIIKCKPQQKVELIHEITVEMVFNLNKRRYKQR